VAVAPVVAAAALPILPGIPAELPGAAGTPRLSLDQQVFQPAGFAFAAAQEDGPGVAASPAAALKMTGSVQA